MENILHLTPGSIIVIFTSKFKQGTLKLAKVWNHKKFPYLKTLKMVLSLNKSMTFIYLTRYTLLKAPYTRVY